MNLPFSNYHFPFNYQSENRWQMEDGKSKMSESGQALVSLLIFVVMGMAIATAASFIIASNSLASTNVQEGLIARQMADSGIEQAFLQLLRNSSYTGTGATPISLNGGTVVVTVTTNGNQKIIDSIATNGSYVKKVEAIVSTNSTLSEISWKEVH